MTSDANTQDGAEIRFLAGDGDLSGDERLKLLAVCVLHQQNAGFRNVIDMREAHCLCGASAFNTGWGYWLAECGTEISADAEEPIRCERHEAISAVADPA